MYATTFCYWSICYGFAMTKQEKNYRRQRLIDLKDGPFEGNGTALGVFLGYKDGAFVRQMISGAREITEKSVAKVHAHHEYRHWFDAPNVEPAPIGMYRVPLISNIQAGMWAEIVDNFQPGDAEEWLLTSTKVSGHAFALKIKGDSMYRADNPESFKEGDVVLIDPDVQPKPGGFVAARNGKQEATFKRYRPRGLNEKGVEYFELVPLNENYPTMRSDLEEITIIGTAVEHRKTL